MCMQDNKRIDYVFVGYPQPDGVGLVETCAVVCNDARFHGVFPSDHCGLYVRLRAQPFFKSKL